MPKANAAYWSSKIDRNRQRGAKAEEQLHAEGWDVCIIWECEIRKPDLEKRVTKFLKKGPAVRREV